jgi:YggT family protein
MRILLHLVDLTLAIYIWVLLAHAVLYWLIGFNRVDPGGRVVAGLSRMTEPVLRPVRSVLPGLGGVDISPLVAIMMIAAARYVIALYILPNLA